MAIADPSYECLYEDVGTNGRVNDDSVWNKCGFSKALENQELSIQNTRCLPRGVQMIPFVVIGDDAFALEAHVMKPYPRQNLAAERRVYNCRHSRVRGISGNHTGKQMGFLSYALMLLEPTAVESATLTLHKMLMTSSAKNICCPSGLCNTEDINQELTLGLWRTGLIQYSL